MRALLPAVADVDLEAAYAYPTEVDGWLRANMVTSLDGAVSVGGSTRGLMTGEDQQVLRLLRDLADAVVVGAGTIRAEGYDALLGSSERRAWRVDRGLSPAPALVVVTRSLDLDPSGPLFGPSPARTIVVTGEALADWAVERFPEVVVTPGQHVDLAVLRAQLHALGMRRLLTEGGPHLLGALVGADLLDELCLTLSPLLVGGTAGRVVQAPDDLRVGMRPAHVLAADDGLLLTRWVRDR